MIGDEYCKLPNDGGFRYDQAFIIHLHLGDRRLDMVEAVGTMWRVEGDWRCVYTANEQGTPVKFRDGPAAVCRWRFLVESHPSLLL